MSLVEETARNFELQSILHDASAERIHLASDGVLLSSLLRRYTAINRWSRLRLIHRWSPPSAIILDPGPSCSDVHLGRPAVQCGFRFAIVRIQADTRLPASDPANGWARIRGEPSEYAVPHRSGNPCQFLLAIFPGFNPSRLQARPTTNGVSAQNREGAPSEWQFRI